MKSLTLLLACLAIGVEGLSQSKMSFDAEFGVSVSSFPESATVSGGKEETRPSMSPLVGFWMTLLADKPFNYSAAIQYYQSGQHYSYSRTAFDQTYQSDYTITFTEDMSFHQLAIPVLVNYNVSLGKMGLRVSAGYRMSLLTGGKYFFREDLNYLNHNNRDYTNEKNFDPFSDELLNPAGRVRSQLMASLQIALTKKWSVALTASQGTAIHFVEQKPEGAIFADPTETHDYTRGDFSLSLKYALK